MDSRVIPGGRWASLRLLVAAGLLLVALLPGRLSAQPVAPGAVVVIDVDGVIGVASTNHIVQGLKQAQAQQAALVVLRMDTPGGLVSSTREIIKAILASKVPIAVYVWPSGGRAASAGTYIAYAGHLAAMAPATSIGAATPVQLGGVPGMPDPNDRNRPEGDKDRKPDRAPEGSAMERKIVNDAVAFIRTLAQLRGRNAEWAEKAVRDAATLTAEEAVKEKVIDLVARDLGDLLARIDGRTVAMPAGERQLAVAGAPQVVIAPDWRTRLLSAIADPNIAYILMLIGIYGIILEFFHPGVFLPGVVGGISLLLALMALTVLPVDYAALGLVLLGVALMVGEAFTPGLGALGLGGLAAFVIGSLFLFDPTGIEPDLALAWPLVAGAAAISALFLVAVLGLAAKARRRRVVSGAEEMVGLAGRVIDWGETEGRVRVHGEVWRARGDRALAPGAPVRVIGLDGLTVIVTAAAQGETT